MDWPSVSNVREVELQLLAPVRSRTTWLLVEEGTPYIPCAFCTNHFLKRWPRELEGDNRVILRVSGQRIEGRAVRVVDAEEVVAVARRSAQKYGGSRAVSAAVEAAESNVNKRPEDDAPDASYWLFRIEPR